MKTEIRNFCIIAHIDHGKSTLADRLLEYTATVSKRAMRDQLLDQMDLERERGITIKLQPVRMDYTLNATPYILNLIDTPGHVDFTYEVSRSLAAVEGAILLVDATQGIQAQTLANLYLALEQNIAIIPAINKIDLPGSRRDEVAQEIINLLGCVRESILEISAKTGEGVPHLLEEVIRRTPRPSENQKNLQALIFDSVYDEYRGVVTYVRLFGGTVSKGSRVLCRGTHAPIEVLEVGYFKPQYTPTHTIEDGEIAYLVTGLKNLNDARVGDTIVNAADTDTPALAGYKEVKPMVFAGFFSRNGDQTRELREAIEKLKLNDAALVYEPEHSPALGFGFRCGFLGLLHLEIIQERLKREYAIDLVVTVPSVAYRITARDGTSVIIRSPMELADPGIIEKIEEPWVRADVITPEHTIGSIMTLIAERKGIYRNTEYLTTSDFVGSKRVIVHAEMPLASILVDFYDILKSISSGYASLNYDFMEYRDADVVRMDIVVADEPVEALASIAYRDQAYYIGKRILESLKEKISRQQFEIKLQAAIGSKIIASERIPALRKDVTAKLYGGDVTRKQKLLEKQKKGKKRMRASGRVEIPTEAYLSVLRKK
ncbi:elongation factor 4 [Candidatus Uhrbacteria bacterium]|nr:elongation factor 4 [Candidatus Uhrbacteria bacterium]